MLVHMIVPMMFPMVVLMVILMVVPMIVPIVIPMVVPIVVPMIVPKVVLIVALMIILIVRRARGAFAPREKSRRGEGAFRSVNAEDSVSLNALALLRARGAEGRRGELRAHVALPPRRRARAAWCAGTNQRCARNSPCRRGASRERRRAQG